MDVFTLLEEIQAVARSGLAYSENPFDRERYERLLALAVAEYADRVGVEPAALRARFDSELGCITPKVGADAAIFDEDGRLLLVLRTDDHRWGLVAGWVEPNEHPADTVVREAREEVGLGIEVEALAGVDHRPAGGHAGPHSVVSVVYLCRRVAGDLVAQPHEVVEARYWDVDEVDHWHLNHETLARIALDARTSRR